MHLIFCLACSILIQLTSAQVLSYNAASPIAANLVSNPNAINLGSTLASNPNAINLASNLGGNTFASNINAINLANNQARANLLPVNNNANFNYGNLNSNYANINSGNGNIARFAVGNGSPLTVSSGSPGNQGYGIQIVADALEIGGSLAVRGSLPVYGTVAMNGRLPTEGLATVNYGCGGRQNV